MAADEEENFEFEYAPTVDQWASDRWVLMVRSPPKSVDLAVAISPNYL